MMIIKRFIVLLMVAILAVLPISAVNGSNVQKITPGSFVSMGTYNGQPILWRVIASNSNGIFLFSDKVITFKSFNSAKNLDEKRDGPLLNFHNTGLGDRYMWGNNMWETSTLREWLNSDQQSISYTRMPPESRYLDSGPNEYGTWWRDNGGDEPAGRTNAYAHEPGFLTNFLSYEKNAIAQVRQKTLLMGFDKEVADGGNKEYPFEAATAQIFNSNAGSFDFSNAYFQWTTDKVFLLCISDINNYLVANFKNKYKSYDQFADDIIIGRATKEALEKDSSRKYQELKHPDSLTWQNTDAHQVDYWLRTPSVDWNGKAIAYVTTVSRTGALEDKTAFSSVISAGSSYVARGSTGVRPALYLKADTRFTGLGTKSNPYRIAGTTNNIVNKENNPSSWAAADIEAAKGYGLTTARVLSFYQSPVTREEFCELAVRLYEVLSGQQAVSAPSDTFSDTKNAEILKAYNLGIVSGVGGGQFAPTQKVTREQIAVMFYRTMKVAKPDMQQPTGSAPAYTDAGQVQSWASEAVTDMSARGIITGTGAGLFSPKGSATKEQAIVLTKRVFEQLK